jgi:uncharacterized protein (TIGR01777 family)
MTDTTLQAIAKFERAPRLDRIVLAGGSGQIGSLLARHFQGRGAKVCVLARTTYSAPWQVTAWDGERLGKWTAQLEDADAIVNLAGRSVNCRYNRWNRREILESRVRFTELLGEAIAGLLRPPRVWLNASTATIYRHALDRPRDEGSGELGGAEKGTPETWRFSISVAKEWERAFFAANTPGTRKVALRSAMTMSPDRGGVFDILSRLTRMGLGGPIGSGEQFVSWIHGEDFAGAVDFLIENQSIDGAVNVSSPNPLRNVAFMESLRNAWGVKVGIPTSRWMLEVGAILIRTESELVLKSRWAVPTRLIDAGFRFRFPEWASAAQDLVEQSCLRQIKNQCPGESTKER